MQTDYGQIREIAWPKQNQRRPLNAGRRRHGAAAPESGKQPNHGLTHAQAVEANGVRLGIANGADSAVVRLFAILHDCRRHNDTEDPGHGARAAALAFELRDTGVIIMDDPEFALLIHACTWHTHERRSTDVTVGTCYDSDRLDLIRFGVTLDLDYFSTERGRQIVGTLASRSDADGAAGP